MIQFTDFTKHYGKTLAMSVPTLQLAGGMYWLKGENGSGKTTLIKCLAGLVPYKGSIAVAGNSLQQNRTEYRMHVNYAEAEPLYPSFLSGNDLLDFYASTKNAPSGQKDQLTAAFSIGHYAGNPTGTYSSGMAKKLSLALAFVGQPKLILLDEPLITLDTTAVGTLQNLIAHEHQAGATFIITSHQEITVPGIPMQQILVKNNTLQLL